MGDSGHNDKTVLIPVDKNPGYDAATRKVPTDTNDFDVANSENLAKKDISHSETISGSNAADYSGAATVKDPIVDPQDTTGLDNDINERQSRGPTTLDLLGMADDAQSKRPTRNTAQQQEPEKPTQVLHPGLKTNPQKSLPEESDEIFGYDDQDSTLVGGEQKISDTPVVGWLVIVDGPGKGNSCTIHYGNNTIGRDPGQRIPLNFGDISISSEQQAFIQYNYKKREFLLVPNLSKTNLVEVNDDALSSPLALKTYDVIRMGETSLLFVPLCGPDFEWADTNS